MRSVPSRVPRSTLVPGMESRKSGKRLCWGTFMLTGTMLSPTKREMQELFVKPRCVILVTRFVHYSHIHVHSMLILNTFSLYLIRFYTCIVDWFIIALDRGQGLS